MNIIRFSVLGFGRIGKRHAKIISEYDGAELVSVTDTNAPALNGLKELGLEAVAYPALEEFLKKDGKRKSEVVCIATPNGCHAQQAVELLNAGYHVLIEKPMGITKEECLKVIAAQEASGKRVFVVKQNRYSPTSLWLKEIVSNGILGDILMVQTNCYWNRDERYYASSDWKGVKGMDGGALFTQFSHFVDILYWVFGDISDPVATVRNFTHPELKDFDDSGFAQFRFEQGGIGSINYSTSCWDRNMESSITVIGSKGSVKVGGQYMDKVEYCHVKDYRMPELPKTNPPNDYGPYTGSAANHHYVIENVVNTLNGKEEPNASAYEGMMVVSMIERIYKAAGF